MASTVSDINFFDAQTNDCPYAAYEKMRGAGVEFTQEPIERYGAWDASFRDPSGNGWKMISGRG